MHFADKFHLNALLSPIDQTIVSIKQFGVFAAHLSSYSITK